ncbi:hypothetical protein AIG97_23615 [Salmonella enterica subsp. enterica serovar Thompson]|nr:hypothetical protein [Salmonella enterica subsp. enterica serovar Thompson]
MLDPTDVTIVGTGVDTGIGSATADGTDIFTPTASGAQILNSSIVNQLNAGTNVTVKTSGTDTEGQTGNIRVNADIVKTAGADAKLTLLADNNIATADRVSIGATTGKLNLDLLAGNTTNNASITLGKFINISLNGGDFLAGAANPDNAVSLTYSNNGQIHGGNVTLNLTRGLNGYAYKVQADDDLTINGPVNGNTGWGVPLSFIAGGNLEMNSPTSISLNAIDTSNGGGRVVISGGKGVSLSTTEGNILLNAASAATNSVNVSSGNGTVSMSAGGNLTLVCAAVTSGTGQDVTMRAAGKDHAMVKITGSIINTSGGNISIDRTAANAMTIKIAGSTLNASAAVPADGEQATDGNIMLNAWNPNINLNTAAYKNSVRNAGAMLEVSGNSQLTGRDLILHTTLEGGNATGLPVFLNNATLTATRDISLSGTALPVTTSSTADDGTVKTNTTTPNAAAIELRGQGNVLTAGGNIVIENQAGGNNNGVYLNGSTSGKAQLTAGGNITLNGSSAGSGSGILVTNSVMNASRAEITGRSGSGVGFSLTNSTLAGALADLKNVILSSAGSGVGVRNALDNRIVNDANLDTLMAKRIENMTSVDMGGQAIFDDTAKTDKGWTQDYTLAHLPNHGWVFNNTSLTAGGDVSLKGAGFTNSTITVTNGSLSIDNSGPVSLSGSTLTMNDGAVNVHAGVGNIDLSKSNISAKGDITLQADGGSIAISGTSATVKSNITSAEGNISVVAYNPSTGGVTGISVTNAQLNAEQGNININGTTPGTMSGGRFTNADLKANADTGSITVYGESKGGQDTYEERGSLYIGGTDTFSAKNINIIGKNLKNSYTGAGLVFDSGTALFNGATFLQGYGYGQGVGFWNAVHLDFKGGDISLKGQTTGPGGSDNYYRTGAIAGSGVYQSAKVYVNLTHSNLKIDADASSSTFGKVPAFGMVNSGTQGYKINGFIFQGDGDVNISGISKDGNAVDVRLFDNTGLVGNVAVTGTSQSGSGIYLGGQLNTTLVNALITGISESGNGVTLTAKSGKTSLDNNTISGTSETGSGIQLTGNNITLTSGTLTGTATSGKGSGVVLTGGSNYTLDGVLVTGTAADGSGIAINGSLTVNNGTAVKGYATGNGNGVTLSGDLSTDSGDGIAITGTALSGDGIKVDGDTTLTNAVLNGISTSGDGVTFAGKVMLDDTSAAALNASSVSGTGLKLADNANVSIKTVTSVTQAKKDADGNPVLDADGNAVMETVTTQAPVTTPVTLTGTSAQGTGVATEGNVSVSGIVLSGSTDADTGTGVSLGGNLTIADDISGVTAGATGNGTALAVNNASIHSDGYTDSGKDFVINASVSGNGTAIKTQGSSQLDGAMLNGNAKGGGTAVELGGNVSGANITGTSDSGTGVHILDGSLLSQVVVMGGADYGAGIKTEGNVTILKGTNMVGTSNYGDGVNVSGSLTKDTGSDVIVIPDSSGTFVGKGNIHGPEQQASIKTLSQGGSVLLTDINQTELNGAGYTGIPPVPVEGYVPAVQPVDISLCDGEHCQSDSLDTGKPVKENVTPSGR